MATAFERVARTRGVEPPKPRPDHLRVVREDEFQPTVTEHRPVRFSEIVGQGELLMRLGTHLKSAAKRGTQPGHVLLDGGPGLGKTTIAQAIAGELTEEYGIPSRCHEIEGDVIKSQNDLVLELAQLTPGDVLFIDEIQAISPSVQVSLYKALEDGYMLVRASKKSPAQRFDLPPITVVAATTHPGKISAPLRDRFKFVGHVQPYGVDDLQLVVLSYAERNEVEIEFDAAEVIARASRFTPRRAIRLLDSVRDYALEVDQDVIDTETALQGLEYCGVDEYGLEDRDRRLMRLLLDEFDGGPIGLAPLASSFGVDVTELTRDIEPYLVQAGVWALQPSGRAATRDTWKIITGSVPPIINGRLR